MTKQLILASQSPRRHAILRNLEIPFTVRTNTIDESVVKTKEPDETVKQLALLKGRSISVASNEVVLAADTVVAYEGNIFGKPKSRQEAYEMITTLNNVTHEVFTGVAIHSNERETVFVEQTKVTWWSLDEDMINWYINTNEPYDKAGAYGIQDLGALFVKEIKGDYYNVVGLPIARVVRELQNFDIHQFQNK